MAIKKTEIVVCDVCQAEVISGGIKGISMPVIFHNEQTEGRGCAPYLSQYKLDLCGKCYQTVLEGNMVFGYGAMGHNTYHFKK